MLLPYLHISFLILMLPVLLPLKAIGQEDVDFIWLTPETDERFVFYGQGWDHDVMESPYDRFPAKAENLVREAVWNLSRHTAGLYLNFITDAEEIRVRYQTNSRYEMPHMPATGVSGVDLYVRSSDGMPWLWCKGNYNFSDTITYLYANLNTRNPKPGNKYEYNLYLPLYNSVKWLEIGIPGSSTVSHAEKVKHKPVVVYGTSIAQGGCASRPAMGWTSIVQRNIDRPVINLSFSVNGRLEEEVIDLIGEIDASLYILDCLPNLTSEETYSDEELGRRIMKSVQSLRNSHPKTPILLASHAGYSDDKVKLTSYERVERVNRILEETFFTLKKAQVPYLYFLPGDEIEMCMDCTVDGVHQSDLGMQVYANAYLKLLNRILR